MPNCVSFASFHERSWQGAVFKIKKKDHFLVFLVVWKKVPKFLGR